MYQERLNGLAILYWVHQNAGFQIKEHIWWHCWKKSSSNKQVTDNRLCCYLVMAAAVVFAYRAVIVKEHIAVSTNPFVCIYFNGLLASVACLVVMLVSHCYHSARCYAGVDSTTGHNRATRILTIYKVLRILEYTCTNMFQVMWVGPRCNAAVQSLNALNHLLVS